MIGLLRKWSCKGYSSLTGKPLDIHSGVPGDRASAGRSTSKQSRTPRMVLIGYNADLITLQQNKYTTLIQIPYT